MAYAHGVIHTLYKKLLRLYPRAFRERLGASMEQTFRDLCDERKGRTAHGFFVLSIFMETAISIVRENLFTVTEGDAMKNILANPRSAALISFILCLPLAIPYLVFMSDIKFLAEPLRNLMSIDGQPGDINMLGRIVILGGLLLLPFAFVLNLMPILRRAGPEGKRTIHTVNLILAVAILLLITFTWGGLIVEEIYCLRGIRCD